MSVQNDTHQFSTSSSEKRVSSGFHAARRFVRAGRWWFWFVFLMIMAAGAFLRFWRLGHQSYWCDETATINKVDGSFESVLRSLAGQGFPPGWYAALWGYIWLLTHKLHIVIGTVLGSHDMRLVPAFLGTLLIPTAYFLGRQFARPWDSMLIMLLAAVNPFLVYYSRDLKMYSAFYLLATLHVALFLKWQESDRQWLWYPLWALAGAAMLLADSLGWFLIGVQVLWMFFKPRHRPWDIPMWGLGVGVIGLVPTWWYVYRSHWLFYHARDVVPWVQNYNVINWRTVLGLPCVHLMGFLWPVYPPTKRMIGWFALPRDFNRHLATQTIPWLAQLEFWLALGVMAVLALSLLPRWGRWKSPPWPERPAGRWWHIAIWIALPMAIFALGSLPPGSRWSIYPHHVIWLQRYLGFIAMAWVLWLGLALVRLPTKQLRMIAITTIILTSVAFSLTNQLTYRQIIWKPIDQVVLKYFNPAEPKDLIMACSRPAHSIGTLPANWLALRMISPRYGKNSDFPIIRRLPNFPLAWIQMARWANSKRSVKTLVIAENMSPDTSSTLNDVAIPLALGPHWRLIKSQVVVWHYQWWFYFFTKWHIRVWQRVSNVPDPNTQPETKHG